MPPPAEPAEPAVSAARVSTGVDGLDAVLHGGLIRGSIGLVTGQPGAGKTILANQACARHVAAGGRAVFVTLLTETHGRMLANLQGLSFFEPAAVGERLFYVSAHTELAQQGLEGLLRLLRQVVRERQATLLVVDGMVNAEPFAASQGSLKRFIQDLQTWVGVVGCTVLLLDSGGGEGEVQPEHTMVDAIVLLRGKLVGQRWVRELLVTKFRGSGFLEGAHAYAITGRGVQVSPRTEALLGSVDEPSEGLDVPPPGRLESGVPGLDAVLGGGLVRGSNTLVLGSSGAGKTILALHFLEAGLRAGERGLYFGFFESPTALLQKAARLGLPLAEHVREGRLQLLWQLPVERRMDALAARLLEAVERHGARRLVVDGLAGFATAALDTERVGGLFAVVNEHHSRRGVTSLLTEEARELFVQSIEAPVQGVSAIAENILFLRHVEEEAALHRLLAVMKTRDSSHDPALYAYALTDRGMEVRAPFRPDRNVFTGVSKPAPGGGHAGGPPRARAQEGHPPEAPAPEGALSGARKALTRAKKALAGAKKAPAPKGPSGRRR
jgi:circadian clock protein KaiC